MRKQNFLNWKFRNPETSKKLNQGPEESVWSHFIYLYWVILKTFLNKCPKTFRGPGPRESSNAVKLKKSLTEGTFPKTLHLMALGWTDNEGVFILWWTAPFIIHIWQHIKSQWSCLFTIIMSYCSFCTLFLVMVIDSWTVKLILWVTVTVNWKSCEIERSKNKNK